MNLDIPFQLKNPWAFPLHGLPLRCSVPFPQGEIKNLDRELALVDEQGRDVGAQWRVLSKWKDGSVRFGLMDYAAPRLAPRQRQKLALKQRPAKAKIPPARAQAQIRLTETASSLQINTGRLRWKFPRKRFALAESIVFDGRDWMKGQASELLSMDMAGQVYRASEGRYKISVAEHGPHRAVVLIEGDYRNGRERFMDYKIRFHFTAGGSQVLMLHTVRNRHAGREGRDVQRLWLEGSLNLTPAKTVRRVMQTARGLNNLQAVIDVRERVDLDGGEYQTAIRNHASLREKPEEVCYSIANNLDMSRYGACAPLIDLRQPGAGGMLFRYAMAAPDREGPFHLGAEGNQFEITFYPTGGQPMHLSEGMGKTRDVLFNFHDDSLKSSDLVHESNNLMYPGVVGVSHETYRQAQFAEVQNTLVNQLNKYMLLESKIDQLLGAYQAYDWPRATGWRDWGDEIGARGRCPEFGVKQFINNEEDYLYCCMIDAWRLGKPYGGLHMARHLMDIDFIDFSTDPARDGAVCPHSTNHTDGEVYPSHQWCQGLLYYYLATGDDEALRISKRIGDNLLWWISGPRKEALFFSGRESAWPMLSLAALYEVTHEKKYRDGGMKILNDLRQTHRKHGQLVWEHPPGSGIYYGYMTAMTFNGIWDMWAATGDKTILKFWQDVTRPVVEALSEPGSLGYIHFRNWQIKWADLTTLARWYALTGDKKYIDLGKNGLRIVLAACPQPLNQTQGFFAMGYRHFIQFLKLADEHGMINDDLVTLVW